MDLIHVQARPGRRGSFASLHEALHDEMRNYRLQEIVRYNKIYRDYLRAHGMDALIARLTAEEPELATIPGIFDRLIESYEQNGLADYDIVCLPIDSELHLQGETFAGLADIRKRLTCSNGISDLFPLWGEPAVKRCRDAVGGLEIVELYEKYPCFDIYDSINENRYFSSYLFLHQEVTLDLLQRISRLPGESNYNYCTEHIPAEFLPVVYYCGEGDYLLLATKSDERLKGCVSDSAEGFGKTY